MKCDVCNKEFLSEEHFKVSGICQECFDTLSVEQKKFAEKKIEELSKKRPKEKMKFNFTKIVIVSIAVVVAGLIIYSLGGSWILYVIGVGVVAAIMYAIYESMVEILTGIIIILGGLVAQFLSKEGILPWYLAVTCPPNIGPGLMLE